MVRYVIIIRYWVIIKSRKTLDGNNSITKIDNVVKFKYLINFGLSNRMALFWRQNNAIRFQRPKLIRYLNLTTLSILFMELFPSKVLRYFIITLYLLFKLTNSSIPGSVKAFLVRY